MGRRSRPPEKEPLPLWKQAVLKWDAAWREAFEERAAIKEYLADMDRAAAEHQAFEELSGQRIKQARTAQNDGEPDSDADKKTR